MTVSDPEVRVDLALKESGCWAMVWSVLIWKFPLARGARGGCEGLPGRSKDGSAGVMMSGKAYQEVRILCGDGSKNASTVAATVTEALEEGEAGGLRERSTEHAVILCSVVGSWEDVRVGMCILLILLGQ